MDYADPPTEEQRWALRNTLYRAGRATALDLAPADAPLAEPLDDSADPGEQARSALALLHALTLAQQELAWLRTQAARAAGATGEATYADIGAAAGITRQSARTRWPGAVADPRPGRPPLPPTGSEEDR